jgi:hypothetical protein
MEGRHGLHLVLRGIATDECVLRCYCCLLKLAHDLVGTASSLGQSARNKVSARLQRSIDAFDVKDP